MQTKTSQDSWLDKLLILPPQTKSRAIPQVLEDNLLISAPSKHGKPGGLYHLTRSSWFGSAEMHVVDVLDTSGIFLQSNLFIRSLQHANTLFIVAYSENGQTWTMANPDLKNIHDVMIFEDSLYVVSCFTNEVAKIDMTGKVEESWKFGAGGHSWHINSLTVWDGRLVATCSGRFEQEPKWGTDLGYPGNAFDVKSGVLLWEGLGHPHCPAADPQGRRFVCNSKGQAVLFKEPSGQIREIKFPGMFPKALAWGKERLYVGCAKYRFPLPGVKTYDSARLAIVDTKDYSILDYIELPFDEMYNIVVVPDNLNHILPR